MKENLSGTGDRVYSLPHLGLDSSYQTFENTVSHLGPEPGIMLSLVALVPVPRSTLAAETPFSCPGAISAATLLFCRRSTGIQSIRRKPTHLSRAVAQMVFHTRLLRGSSVIQPFFSY